MTPERTDDLLKTYRDGLLADVMPFWIKRSPDPEFGGFLTALARDGTVIDTDKSVWHQGRFAWMLGELYNNVEQRNEWLELARSGVEFLERYCFDPADGRLWFHVTRDGRPIRKRRYAFTEAFAAIAYGELAQATGEDRYRDKARLCFRRFIDHSRDPQGVVPKFTDVRPTKGFGFPMITIGTAQELRDSIGLEDANELIDQSIDTIRVDHMKPELRCVMETVGTGGDVLDHFDGRLLNPGHALEAAWFILREAQIRNGDLRLIETGTTILDWMWEWGWDKEYGGIIYFRDVKHLPPQEYWHDMKFWWPQNEAIIATLLAHLLTGDEKYAQWHRLAHDWAYRHFADPEHGEWYGYLHRDGRISHTAKGNLWKGPFHLPRMQLVCWKLLESTESTRPPAPNTMVS